MVKRLPLLLLAALLIACQPYYGENWKQISEAGFTVMMPGEPERKGQDGGAVFTLVRGSEMFFINYRLTLSAEQPEQALDLARNGFITTIGGTLIEEKSINVSGHPGREIVFEKLGKTSLAKIVSAKSILYFVSVTRDESAPLSEDGRKFLDSFRVT